MGYNNTWIETRRDVVTVILCASVDNALLELGLFEGEQLLMATEIGCDGTLTAVQYAVAIRSVLAFGQEPQGDLAGAILSSVVPSVTEKLRQALALLTGRPPLVVGPGMRTGLNVRLDNISSVGGDFICCCIGALEQAPPPLVVANLGWVSTFSGLDPSGTFVGRSILPGVVACRDMLHQGAAQLPSVALEGEAPLLGRSTGEAIRSGLLHGYGAMLDGLAAQYEEQLGTGAQWILTGSNAPLLRPYCGQRWRHLPHLTLQGLCRLYRKNDR